MIGGEERRLEGYRPQYKVYYFSLRNTKAVPNSGTQSYPTIQPEARQSGLPVWLKAWNTNSQTNPLCVFGLKMQVNESLSVVGLCYAYQCIMAYLFPLHLVWLCHDQFWRVERWEEGSLDDGIPSQPFGCVDWIVILIFQCIVVGVWKVKWWKCHRDCLHRRSQVQSKKFLVSWRANSLFVWLSVTVVVSQEW